MKQLQNSFREILHYPSAVAGLGIILILIVVAVVAVFTYSYDDAVTLWRGNEEFWYMNPKFAPPMWYNWFRKEKLPLSFQMKSTDENVTIERQQTSSGNTDVIYTFPFDYAYDDFAQGLALFFTSTWVEKQPFVSIVMITPDGRELRIGDLGVNKKETYRFGQDERLTRRLGGLPAQVGLFADPNVEGDPVPLKGHYQLQVTALTFEPDTTVNIEFVLYGQLYGWAGTDHLRRDIGVALLYGTPLALIFGLAAAIGVNVFTIVISAVGVWFGGIVDGIIQRITEVSLTLPFLSILIMVGTFYSKSIWVILGVTILLSIFGGAIKGYRAIFLQVKESTYIEAAQAYGAGNWRIIFLYLIPRIIPLLIPGLVLAVPSFVFLEASLAVLGLGDPVLPTWGKIINDASVNAALYNGFYYWILEPAVLLMLTGLAFAMVGYSLDRIFNPRLRGL